MNTNCPWKLALWKYTLPGRFLSLASLIVGTALLFAANASAQGNPTPWEFSGGTLVGAAIVADNGSGDYTNLGIITVVGDVPNSTAGIATDQLNKTFGFTSINVTGDAASTWDELIGFLYITNDSAPVTASTFTGSISGGTITVHSNVGAAYGAFFRDVQTGAPGAGEWSLIDTSNGISLGAITVTSADAGATGFASGGLDGGTIRIASITATGHDQAAGVLVAGDIARGSTFEVTSLVDVTNMTGPTEHAYGFDIYGGIGGILKAGAITVTNDGASGAYGIRVTGVNDDGTITVGGPITVQNVAGEAYGIRATAAGISVNNGTATNPVNINVTTESGLAAGAVFTAVNDSGRGTIDKNIKLGNINATATGSGSAYGFSAGKLHEDGSVTLGDVRAVATNASGTGGEAAGVEFRGDVEGTLKIKSIYAKADTGVAKGITVTNDGFTANLGKNDNFANIGAVTAISNNNKAYGVFVDAGDAFFNLQGDIDADGTEGYGIVVQSGIGGSTFGNASITVDKKFINISGSTAAIKTDGTLDIDLKGNALTSNGDIIAGYGMTVDGNGGTFTVVGNTDMGKLIVNGTSNSVTITGTITNTGGADVDVYSEGMVVAGSVDVIGDLTVTGNGGTADLGIVKVGGKTVIGDGNNAVTVALDKDASTLGSDNELNANATLVLGDTFMFEPDAFDTLGTWKVHEEAILGGGIFTDWFVNSMDILQARRASSAHMNDGYLAAFGIHNRYTVWNAVHDRMISGSGRNHAKRHGHGYHGQAPCDPIACDPCAPRTTYPAGIVPNTAWVNYIGRSDTYRSSYNNRDWRLSMEGVQVGTDLTRSKRGQLGLLFGYETGKSTNTSDRVNAEDIYIGVYTACVLDGGADIRGVFGYGWQEYDLNRRSGNLYTSSFKGHTIEGNLEIGKRISSGPWSVRPVLAVDVTNNEIKGTTEKGGSQAVKYDNAHLTQVFVRAGSELRYRMGEFTVNSGIYYAYDVHGQDRLNTNVSTLDGLYSSQLSGTHLGRSLLLFNVGGECQVTHAFAVIGGYEGQVITDRHKDRQSIGYIGGSWKW